MLGKSGAQPSAAGYFFSARSFARAAPATRLPAAFEPYLFAALDSILLKFLPRVPMSLPARADFVNRVFLGGGHVPHPANALHQITCETKAGSYFLRLLAVARRHSGQVTTRVNCVIDLC